MAINLNELKCLAEAARGASSQWYSYEDAHQALERLDFSMWPEDDSAYIAAMSPEVTLRLIEIIEIAKDALDAVRDDYVGNGHLAGKALTQIAKLEQGNVHD